MKFVGNAKEYIYLETINNDNCDIFKENIKSSLTILWFVSDNNLFIIDGKEVIFSKNEIVFLTEFHKVIPKTIGDTRILQFNRPFYCVLDHDTEVGCKGLLFFGAAQLPRLTIPKDDFYKFNILWEMFTIEIESTTNKLQIDMLQMMLKRYLILCARLYTIQKKELLDEPEVNIIREYNFFIEQYFKSKHTVAEYAVLLHKSPKTLSNIFSKIGSKMPLQYIQERIMLEARRQLYYTEKPIKEIAYDLGYDDIQAFSRFFKKQEGMSPTEYKKA
jgi:AraC-like DNA-binding protein